MNKTVHAAPRDGSVDAKTAVATGRTPPVRGGDDDARGVGSNSTLIPEIGSDGWGRAQLPSTAFRVPFPTLPPTSQTAPPGPFRTPRRKARRRVIPPGAGTDLVQDEEFTRVMPHTADFVVPSRRRAKRRVGTDSDRNLRDRHAEPLLGFHRRHRRL